MAGDWIKLEHATISKPEVIAMADLLEKTPEEVFGMLFHVWCWFDKQSRDGNAGSVTGNALLRFIDHLVRRPGFASCMVKVGWLTDTGLPNFARHNGETAKKRALTNDRVKRSRNANSNAYVTLDALPEKRREEKKETPIAPSDSANRSAQKVTWSETGFDIPEVIASGFASAYPAVDWRAEVAKANAWVLANPKNRKSNWGRFLNNWLQRAQDRGGSSRAGTAADNPIYADMGLR